MAHLLVEIVLDYELNGMASATVAQNADRRQRMEQFDTDSEAFVNVVDYFEVVLQMRALVFSGLVHVLLG